MGWDRRACAGVHAALAIDIGFDAVWPYEHPSARPRWSPIISVFFPDRVSIENERPLRGEAFAEYPPRTSRVDFHE
jgi:hypothetical protein